MTIKQSTGCTLIQGFPVLLILAQKYNRCLETPFEYHPPSPTQSPEYYEALDALYHTLFGHGYDHGSDNHGYGMGHHVYGTGHHEYGTGHHGYDTSHHGYGTGYHGYGTGHHGYGTGYQGYGTSHHGYGTGYHGHGSYGNKYPENGSHVSKPSYMPSYNPYHGHPVHHGYNGVKRVFNYTSVKGHKTYAPSQTYNIQNKYKVVVRKNKRGHRHHKRRSGKLQGFFSQRDDRRYDSPFQNGFRNLLSGPKRITERLTGILHLRPENQNSNPSYVYPFRRPGITTENQQSNNYPYQNGQNGNYNQGGYEYQNGNQGYGNNYGQNYGYNENYGNPIAFPTSSPDGTAVNFVNNNGGQYTESNPANNNGGDPINFVNNNGGQYTESNPANNNGGDPVNFVNNNGGQYTESNPSNNGTPVNFVDNSNGQYTESNGSNNQPNAPIYEETYQNNNNGEYEQKDRENEHSNVSLGEVETGNGIPNTPPIQDGFSNEPPFSTGNNGIPNTPPAGIPSESPAGIPDVPPAGIPNVPPPGFPTSPPAGIPNVPPVGIPTGPPPGIPNVPPPLGPQTELPALTPVPDSEKRNNFNFGSAGLFKETCQIVGDQELGSCISILECQPFLEVLRDSRTNPKAVQMLRRAHCGFEGSNPKVCCPKPRFPSLPPTAPPTTTTTTTTIAPQNPDDTNPANLGPEDFVASFPEPPVCGFSNASFSRVVGGVPAKLGDFPWMALLGYKRGTATRWLCGGSLVSSKHVLTAAHCINGHESDLYLVRLGELDLEREDEGATPVDVLIKYKIKHEEYSPTAFTNDIGILVLDKEMSFTDLIKPICIPKDSELRARSFENYTPIIAGWGDTEFRGPSASHLQALQLPVVSNDFCAQAYVNYKNQRIDDRVLCAGYKKGGKDACQGDSGGPLMQPIWNSQDFSTHFYQIGVVSFGRKCAEAGFPGVYTRVTHFVPWLEQKILGA